MKKERGDRIFGNTAVPGSIGMPLMNMSCIDKPDSIFNSEKVKRLTPFLFFKVSEGFEVRF